MTQYGLIEVRQTIFHRRRPQPWARRKCFQSTQAVPRQRRSDFWSPKVKLPPSNTSIVDTTARLRAAGFIRQNYAGIYQFLPLGLRVLEKIERLIDKHMRSVGASKVSLSSISSQTLWDRSGRLGHGEMFKLEDRSKGKWLLAPTHEEEITTMMQDYLSLQSQLPVRLYQIGRKYRDEQRPRGGLLRGREFVMKDLYTFDKTLEDAEATYQQVRTAYRAFFSDLGVPFVEVRADSGNMGGDLSHEFHFPNAAGEDTVITCDKCDFAKNEEFAPAVKTVVNTFDAAPNDSVPESAPNLTSHTFVSKDSKTLVRVLTKSLKSNRPIPDDGRARINTYILKSVLGAHIDVDTSSEASTAEQRFLEESNVPSDGSHGVQIYYVLDKRVTREEAAATLAHDRHTMFNNYGKERLPTFLVAPASQSTGVPGFDLLRHQSGDACSQCQTGKLSLRDAIEIGHTFHLGTRYTAKFGLRVPTANLRDSKTSSEPFVEMGCHGIGVSRLVAAAAACTSTEDHLRWPVSIAPYHVVLCVDGGNRESVAMADKLYDELSQEHAGRLVDVLIDDREDVSLGWKFKDARAIGYPVIIVLGKALMKGMAEVIVARPGEPQRTAKDVNLEQVSQYVRDSLESENM